MTHIQQRRDDSAVWTSVNPVMYDGEAGHESDTGRWKLGDGVTAWVDLPYKSGVDSVAGKTGVVLLEVADVDGAAPLVSPVFTGNPTAPTPLTGDDDTSIATTEFVKAQEYAPLASPVFTGNPTAPTPSVGDDDTSVATTGFVKDVVGPMGVWQQYTPTVTGGYVAGAGATLDGWYCEIGDTIHFKAWWILGTGFTISSGVGLSLPVPMSIIHEPVGIAPGIVCRLTSAGDNIWVGGSTIHENSLDLFALGVGGEGVAISYTVPFTWKATDVIEVAGSYEKAVAP